MTKTAVSILALAVALGLSGCSLFKKSNPGHFESGDAIPLYPVNSVGGKADTSLGGHWYIRTVGSITLRSIEDDDWPYIEFAPGESRFYGTDGCNLINGSYKEGPGHTLDLSNVATTMMLCEGDTLAYPIARALENTRGFSVGHSGDGSILLSLLNEANAAVMTLSKSDIDFLNGPWQVVAVNGHEINVEDARLVFDIGAGSVTGSAGCNRLRGDIARNPKVSTSVQFSSLATTRMTCPDIQTETALLIALEEVVSARRGSRDTVDLLNASGHPVVTLSRLTRSDFQQ